MGWSAFLWTYLWVFFGLGALALGLAAFFVIRHFVKKHKAKKVTAGKQANVKVKDNEKAKEKAKRKELLAQKKAEKKAKKQDKKEQDKAKKEQEQTVKPRQPKPTKEVQTEKVDKISKFALPRFDLRDAKIIEKDKAKFIKHQELYIKQKKYSLTKDEQKQLEEINADFVRDYGHIPNQEIDADHTDKPSGCYCFNGKESKNFKKYCQEHPYDATKDNGDRTIIQIDLGKKASLHFCVSPDEMYKAACKDIMQTLDVLEKNGVNLNKTSVSILNYDGQSAKFSKPETISIADFQARTAKNLAGTKQPSTPELGQ